MDRVITISGVNVVVPLSVSGGLSYSIDGGATYSTAIASIVAGQVVRLRMAASGSYASTLEGRVTVGGRTEAWALTTKNEPNTAPVFPTIAPIALVSGTAGSITLPAATDTNRGDILTYSFIGLPTGFVFNPTTRVLSWDTTIPAGTGSISYNVVDNQ